MKAGIFFTGSGPILLLTSYDSLTNENLLDKLTTKEIKKSVAFEVPTDTLQQKYGKHYKVITNESPSAG